MSPLQLLFGVFWLRLLQITAVHQVSTAGGENVTLRCNSSGYTVISWYRLRDEEVEMLISAKQGKLAQTFLLSYNLNESRYESIESNSSVSVTIIGVKDTDLGFYFCGAQIDSAYVQFVKLIRLKFTDDETPPDIQLCPGTELWILRGVCLLSGLINLICISVFCYKLSEKSCCSCCSHTKDSGEKSEPLHYASIQHNRKSRAAAKKHTPDSGSVTYTTVTTLHRRP